MSEADGGRPERDDRDDRGRSDRPRGAGERRGSGWSDDRRGGRPSRDSRDDRGGSRDDRGGGDRGPRGGGSGGDRDRGGAGGYRGERAGRDDRGGRDGGSRGPRDERAGHRGPRDDRGGPDRRPSGDGGHRGARDDRPRGGYRDRDDRRDDRPRPDRRDDRPRDDRPRGASRDRDRDQRSPDRRDDRPRAGSGDRRGGYGRDDRGGRRDRTAGPRNAGPPRRRQGPSTPPSSDPARAAAFELLTAVRERDAYANLVFPSILRRYGLKDRDAALATELGYGTLRAAGQMDAVIEACADRPLHRVERQLVDAMRLGAYQILRMRVPEHAAVATAVDLVRETEGSRSSGFVNAILRKVAETAREKGAEEWLAELAPSAEEDPVGRAAFLHAHPKWIAQAFVDALGSRAELDAALAADDARPAVHLLAKPGEISAEELALVTGGTEAPYSPYGVHLEPGSGDIGELDVIREGVAAVQDEGSQLVALALTRVPVDGDSGRWLDLCAGPGGKAALLGGIAAMAGGRVDAVEPAEHRADLVRRAVDGLPVTVHTADGRDAPLEAGVYDRVLVDAPCTGLGALRRRPESRWRRKPEDVANLTKLQRELLLAAFRHVRVGGVVAYVTCSPHLSETVGVVGGIVRRKDLEVAVEYVDAREFLPGVPDLGDGPHVQLWPHRHGTDAMFLTLLRRTA